MSSSEYQQKIQQEIKRLQKKQQQLKQKQQDFIYKIEPDIFEQQQDFIYKIDPDIFNYEIKLDNCIDVLNLTVYNPSEQDDKIDYLSDSTKLELLQSQQYRSSKLNQANIPKFFKYIEEHPDLLTKQPQIIILKNLKIDNNIIINLFRNFSGRCFKNVVYQLFVCNPLFQNFMKHYKNTSLYKLFFGFTEHYSNKIRFLKWFEENFALWKKDEGGLEGIFIKHLLYGIYSYLMTKYKNTIIDGIKETNIIQKDYNNLFNITYIIENRTIKNPYIDFIFRGQCEIKDILKNIKFKKLPDNLIFLNKSENLFYYDYINQTNNSYLLPNNNLTLKTIDDKEYKYTLYGFVLYMHYSNDEHAISVIKNLGKIDYNQYYIFNNYNYIIYDDKPKFSKSFSSQYGKFYINTNDKLKKLHPDCCCFDYKHKEINDQFGISHSYTPTIFMYIRDDIVDDIISSYKYINYPHPPSYPTPSYPTPSYSPPSYPSPSYPSLSYPPPSYSSSSYPSPSYSPRYPSPSYPSPSYSSSSYSPSSYPPPSYPNPNYPKPSY